MDEGAHQGLVEQGVAGAGGGDRVAAGVAEPQSVPQLVPEDLLGEPGRAAGAGEEAGEAVVDHHVPLHDPVVGLPSPGGDLRLVPGSADGEHPAAGAVEGGDVAAGIVEDHGVDPVAARQPGGRRSGSRVAVVDPCGRVVRPGAEGLLEFGVAAPREPGLAGVEGPPLHLAPRLSTLLESEPAQMLPVRPVRVEGELQRRGKVIRGRLPGGARRPRGDPAGEALEVAGSLRRRWRRGSDSLRGHPQLASPGEVAHGQPRPARSHLVEGAQEEVERPEASAGGTRRFQKQDRPLAGMEDRGSRHQQGTAVRPLSSGHPQAQLRIRRPPFQGALHPDPVLGGDRAAAPRSGPPVCRLDPSHHHQRRLVHQGLVAHPDEAGGHHGRAGGKDEGEDREQTADGHRHLQADTGLRAKRWPILHCLVTGPGGGLM